MKKFIIFLWLIIIVGVVLIVGNYFKPETVPNGIDYDEVTENITTTTTPTTTTTEPTTPVTTIPNVQTTTTTPKKTYQEYIQEGDAHIENMEIQAAIESYTEASIANPNSTEPLLRLGEAYLKNNEPKNAQAAFEKAQVLDPDSTLIKVAIARSYLNQREIEKAKDILWALSTDDQYVKYYTAIVLILYKDFTGSKNLFKELAEAHQEAVKSGDASQQLDPHIIENTYIFLDAHETFSYFSGGEKIHLQTLLAKALTDVGEYEAAIPLLFDVINEKNNYRDAWIVLGYAYLNTDKINDAIDAFLQAKALDENKPETLFFLGLAYFANNEIDKAVYYIEQADKNGYEPKDQIDSKLGDLYLLQNEYQKSAEKYEAVLEKNKTNMGVFIRVVWLNIDRLNKPEKALEYALIALKEHPDEAMSYNLIGWAYTALDNFDEAQIYLAKAIELNPNFDAATLNLGWFYEKQGQTTLAKEYYKKAYLLGKDNSIASLAATRYNNLQINLQVNISSPTSP